MTFVPVVHVLVRSGLQMPWLDCDLGSHDEHRSRFKVVTLRTFSDREPLVVPHLTVCDCVNVADGAGISKRLQRIH